MSTRIPQHKMLAFAALATLGSLALAACSSPGSTASTPTPSTTAPATTAAPSSMPTAPATTSATPQTPRLTTHSIAKGHFELTMPADWRMKEIKLEPWQEDRSAATSLRIQNAKGKDMAVFMSGGPGPSGLSLMDDGEKYTQLDKAKPALKTQNFYSFEALGAKGEKASINLSAFDLGQATTLSHLESLVSYDDGHGYFGREIAKDEKLDGVPASAKGMERLQAYAKSAEYGQIKAMMLSLKQTKSTGTGSAQAEGAGTCIGAVYTYDLAGSGLSCAEAKSFVQKLSDSRPSAGAVEILGHGACELPYPGNPGKCVVEGSGATFSYQMK